jgi:para-nitrobenzyl esterase
MQARWLNFATHGKPIGLPDEPDWIPYQDADRACLVIDRTDEVVNDVDHHIRAMWADKVLYFR